MLLIVAEKHDQQKAYVKALQGKKPVQYLNKYITRIVDSPVLPDYPDIRVAYLQGHLYELYEPSEYDKRWQKWDLSTLPIFPQKMKMHLKRGFGTRRKAIADQIAQCDDLWLASDSDVEGENLGYIFLLHNQGLPKLNGRVWQNSQTKSSLIKAFHHVRNPKDTIGNAHAGYCRMIADWYIGMNYSRLMSILLHKKGYRGVYSVGRVQTPTLHLINERRKQRDAFVDKSVYAIRAFDSQGLAFNTSKEDAFPVADDAQNMIQKMKDHPFQIQSVRSTLKEQSAPKLYKTGQVQGYLVRKRHISSQQALDNVLEHMYNSLNIISYPRTDCNLLTLDDYNELKKNLPTYAKCYEDITQESIRPYLTNLKPDKKHVDFNGKKVQKVGHHALTPDRPIDYTEYQKLNTNEKVAYQYILSSTLAMFMPNHQYHHYKIDAKNQLPFKATYDESLNDKNWKLIYHDDSTKEERPLDMSIYHKGQELDISAYRPKEIKAKPPKAITESNLVGAIMPQYHLGTQATRGNIINNLTHRDIIQIAKRADKKHHQVKGEFIPTNKGVVLLEAMRDANLLNLARVQSWEDKMTAIAQGDEPVGDFLKQIKISIYQDIRKLPNDDFQLTIAPHKRSHIQDKKSNILGIVCPKCKQGQIEHLTMTKNNKPLDFYSCTNRKCNFITSGNFAGLPITPVRLQNIVKGQSSPHKFKSKKGKEFQAKLVYDRGKIKPQFIDNRPSGTDVNIKCPKCKRGHLAIIDYRKKGQKKSMYVCSNPKCKFIAPMSFAGVEITPPILDEIILGNFPTQTFTSKRKHSHYQARLAYEDGRIQMEFAD